jgi:hypothetical protein
MSLGLSIVAILLLLVSGWLGGKMVYEEGVAVHAEGAGAAASGTWRADGNRAWSGSGTLRGDRAMASDSTAPMREPTLPRDERPAAHPEPGDTSR